MKNWGECFAAAVASVLEMPLEEMPKIPMLLDEFFVECKKDGIKPPITRIEEYYADQKILLESEWYRRFSAWLERNAERIAVVVARVWEGWLEQHDLEILTYPPTEKIPGYSIANCEFGAHTHALVLKDGEIVFDPEEGFGPDKMEFPWEIRRIHLIVQK